MRIYCQRCKKEHRTIAKRLAPGLILDIPECHPLGEEGLNAAYLSRLCNEGIVSRQELEKKLEEAHSEIEFLRKENHVLRKKLHSIYQVLAKINENIE